MNRDVPLIAHALNHPGDFQDDQDTLDRIASALGEHLAEIEALRDAIDRRQRLVDRIRSAFPNVEGREPSRVGEVWFE